jgi:endonuclease IV
MIKRYRVYLNTFYILVAMIAILPLFKNNERSISSNALKKIIRGHKHTLVYVWTKRCAVSKSTIPTSFYHIQDALNNAGMDNVAVVLLTPDIFANEDILDHKKNGIVNSFSIRGGFVEQWFR